MQLFLVLSSRLICPKIPLVWCLNCQCDFRHSVKLKYNPPLINSKPVGWGIFNKYFISVFCIEKYIFFCILGVPVVLVQSLDNYPPKMGDSVITVRQLSFILSSARSGRNVICGGIPAAYRADVAVDLLCSTCILAYRTIAVLPTVVH